MLARPALRWHLLTLVVLAVLPPALFSVWLGLRLREGQFAALQEALREASRAVAISIEREMGETTETLQALALDPALERGDLRAFYDHARVVASAERRWHDIALVDARGQILLDVDAPFGTRLPSVADRDDFQRVLQTARPVVSDVVFGATSALPAVYVSVPVQREGRLRYVLVGSLHPPAWASMAASSQVHPDWIVSVSDGTRRYIARSRNGENVIGQRLPGDLARAVAAASTGFARLRILEGDEAYIAWHAVPGTSWVASLGTVAGPIDAAGRRLALATAGAGALFAVVAALVALVVAGRIAAGVHALARAAAAIGRGEQPEPSASGVAELNEVGVALSSAGRQRAAANAALRAAEERAWVHATQAEEATRAKDRFLAMLSHELRTPLSAILGWTRVLAAPHVDGDTQRRALATIERSAWLQTKLIDDLLDVSRIVTGNLKLDRAPVAIARVVAAAIDTTSPAAAPKHIEIVQHLDPACGTVDGDHARLEQVVSNLVGNAIKFTPDGGRVTVALASEGDRAVLTVTDTGEGIEADFLPYVFDRFRQGEQTLGRSPGGLGLGLTIVRYLVEAHGGTVAAASEGRGRGATFTVRLPLCACPAPESDEVTAGARPTA